MDEEAQPCPGCRMKLKIEYLAAREQTLAKLPERRERIATAICSGCATRWSTDDRGTAQLVDYSIRVADLLIAALDKKSEVSS